jgi:poly-gamma-glutamate capsule biosynthesis protein CapA/YwtB (metallophosphatase superfamily)
MSSSTSLIKIFLCGDVMTGRGIDQILSHPCNPRLYEENVRSALDYVCLAEDAHGKIPRPVALSYIWGSALAELERERPDLRIVNLETSITRSETFAPKGINYRMSPENAGCLRAAGIDCCTLANNHTLDWGEAGLLETLDTLEGLGIKTAGAGRNCSEAWALAALDILSKSRVLVLSCASVTSGVPVGWAATRDAPGVALLPDMTERSVALIAKEVARVKRSRDIVILSIHWGPNWGYDVGDAQRQFAHELIDRADISVLHGHSSHHAKGIEVYRNRLILYGCGDFMNDYEGISGYEDFRDDLTLMYFVEVNPANGNLVSVRMTPFQIQHFRLRHVSSTDADWLRETLDKKCTTLGARIEAERNGRLRLSWSASAA